MSFDLKLFAILLLLCTTILAGGSADFSTSTHSIHLSQTPGQTQSVQNSSLAHTANGNEQARPAMANLFDRAMPTLNFKQLYEIDDSTVQKMAANGPIKVSNRKTPFLPTKENIENEMRLITANYDTTDPRLTEMLKFFGNFENKGVDRLARLAKDNTSFPDLNDSEKRRLKNPQSFNYQNYFDGSAELNSSSAMNVPKMSVRAFFPKRARKLRLQEFFEKPAKLDQTERILKLEEGLARIEKKLASVLRSKQVRRLAQEPFLPQVSQFVPPMFYYPLAAPQHFVVPMAPNMRF